MNSQPLPANFGNGGENAGRRLCIGQTVEGRELIVLGDRDLEAADLPAERTFLIGGMHGDETATIILLEDFCARFAQSPLPTPTAIMPVANPDGYERRSRYNARGVDLNRNCAQGWSGDSLEPPGPGPWSEPEICALRDFILRWRPTKIVSLHWALAELDADGVQSTPLAQTMWDALDEKTRGPYRLRVTEIGRGKRRLEHTYSVCPGSLGQWCGFGLEYEARRRPAMITLELPYDPVATERPDPLPDDHLADLHSLWRRDSAAYLRAIEPGVHQMLLAACAFGAQSGAS